MEQHNSENLFFTVALLIISIVTITLILVIQSPILVIAIGLGFVFTLVVLSVLYVEYKLENNSGFVMLEEIEDVERSQNKNFLTDEEIEDYLFTNNGE